MQLNTDPEIQWTLLSYKEWNIYIAAASKGLCFIGSQNQSFDELSRWVESRFPGSGLTRNDEILKPYKAELIEYLQGRRTHFTISVDFRGTPFQISVWDALCEIPYGQTRSYSDIADHIRKPNSVRAVGAAIGANPLLITVPCHRVIGKNGALTGYRGGLEMKARLLELEKESTLFKGSLLHA
jgi:methylated-DNA-[protein]-cysteine S-methyltransferase